ncbi:hypothetical protein DPMN_121664 [Dreissena polymorpha]|uniref:Chitin-binding type-2 domain-containing protein n=1 Tax=Dreissena polymorpha TaxID=45954 RepID=A0A9D4JPM8_DREPO|nr:hypothetical protein DPMN_121664 [Dreissena polymorpha]
MGNMTHSAKLGASQRLQCHLAVSCLVPVPNLSINLKEDGNQAAFAFINDNQRVVKLLAMFLRDPSWGHYCSHAQFNNTIQSLKPMGMGAMANTTHSPKAHTDASNAHPPRQCPLSIEEQCNMFCGIIVHPTECRAYYNCSVRYQDVLRFLEQHLVDSPYPELFNVETKQCEHFENVKCGSRREFKDASDAVITSDIVAVSCTNNIPQVTLLRRFLLMKR